MPTPEIILIGAGRSPYTKQRRRIKRPTRRNLWIGTRQIMTGMRYPVEIEFVQQNFDKIAAGIDDGVLLVEYRNDKFVDPEELKVLAFGSEEEKAAYEEQVAAEVAEQSAELLQRGAELKAEEDDRILKSVQGDYPIGEDGQPILPEYVHQGATQPVLTDNATRLNGDVRTVGVQPPTTNPTPRELATAVSVAEGGGVVSGATATDGATTDTKEPEYKPGAASAAQGTQVPPDMAYKPLPTGWKDSNKTELMALCEERNIDTSDLPSNRELRHRLEQYAARG